MQICFNCSWFVLVQTVLADFWSYILSTEDESRDEDTGKRK